MKLKELASRIGADLEGDGQLEILGVGGLRESEHGEVSFLSNPKYASQVFKTHASAVIVPEDWDRPAPCALLRVKNPDQAFTQAAECFYTPRPRPAPGVHPTAVIADSVVLGEDVCVGPYCVLEDGVVLGDRTILSAHVHIGYKTTVGCDCLFYPQVSVYELTQIGDRVILHSGAVIGADGFGYAVDAEGVRTKIPQIGRVVLEDDVEVGANSAIDRARFGKTRIGKGTKIDNLVQIGHNVVIGEHSVLCGQVGVSGSSTIGSMVILAGQVGLAGHLEVCDGAIVGAQAGVMKDVPPKEFVIGSPAMNHLTAKKIIANTLTLPKLKERVKRLEKQINQLTQEKEEK